MELARCVSGGCILFRWGESIDSAIRSLQLFDQMPDMGNIQELQKLAKEKGGDFEKLLSETVDEVKKLLEEKGKKAKDLAGETGQEAKKQATK